MAPKAPHVSILSAIILCWLLAFVAVGGVNAVRSDHPDFWLRLPQDFNIGIEEFQRPPKVKVGFFR
eukprot:scaffold622556_cov43-Prasinocladus_malaysianus.AAC.1